MNNYHAIAETFISEAERIFKMHFTTPLIYFDLKGKAAGQANLLHWFIRINRPLLDAEGFEAAYSTVGHEIAHLIAWHVYQDRGHGPYWASVMRHFGLPAERCHNYKNTKPAKVQRRWIYVCNGCNREHTVSTYTHKRINSRRCSFCHSNGKTFTFKGQKKA